MIFLLNKYDFEYFIKYHLIKMRKILLNFIPMESLFIINQSNNLKLKIWKPINKKRIE